tara:strand:+ start:777 stop:1142 length:366 start_codon:yes stop_codon:yes gene_type:complete
MTFTEIDRVIEENLEKLHEEKYKLRIFQVELLLKINSEFGVEETLQDIRSIGGVTVVTALDSLFRKGLGSYLSRVKIKFHPQKDSTRPVTFVKDHLLPVIRSSEIPGCAVVRVAASPQQVA